MIVVLYSVVWMAILCPLLWRIAAAFLSHQHMLRANYSGRPVLIGSGIILFPLYVIHMTVTGLLGSERVTELVGAGLSVIAVLAIGWLDDTKGSAEVRGLKGHWYAWTTEGRWTTGMTKVVGIAAVSAGMAASRQVEWSALLAAMLLPMLSANAINMLDVRPGRALKGVIAALILLLLISHQRGDVLIELLPVMMAAFYLIPRDLRQESMLGDTGANAFGFAVGYGLAYYASPSLQWLVTVGLIALHLLAERTSISSRIERNRLLRWLDQWGRASS
jgi:UDP-GlcNAc:undecaprenyl-phosphate/decaprenyl-phosphate GlcNAc-1-phosphate transferase